MLNDWSEDTNIPIQLFTSEKTYFQKTDKFDKTGPNVFVVWEGKIYRTDQRFSESRNLNLRMLDNIFEFRFCRWQWQEVFFNKTNDLLRNPQK